MIDYREAQAFISATIEQLPAVTLPLLEARSRVLAIDLCAPFPIPRFDHSAVDGYAIRSDDCSKATTDHPARLRVTGEVRTGSSPVCTVEPHSAVKVFTGAMLPADADTVIMVEDVVRENDVIVLTSSIRANRNIRRKGEEFAQGSVCLPQHTLLTPPALALAATLGFPTVQVYRSPRVSVIVTGPELIEPGNELNDAQIYDSNRFGLISALAELDIEDVRFTHCADDENALVAAIDAGARSSDMVITTGGASVGDVDFVKPAIQSLGGTIHFDSVAIKPGKPFVFATVNGIPLCGLPGNPVSALVTYLLFVRPALMQMAGDRRAANVEHPAVLDGSLSKRTPRVEFVRANSQIVYNQRVATPCSGQESHMLGGLVKANSLIVFDGEAREIRSGSAVRTIPIEWH